MLVLPAGGMDLVRFLRQGAVGGVQDRTGSRVLGGPLRQPGRRPPLDGAGTTSVCAGRALSRRWGCGRSRRGAGRSGHGGGVAGTQVPGAIGGVSGSGMRWFGRGLGGGAANSWHGIGVYRGDDVSAGTLGKSTA